MISGGSNLKLSFLQDAKNLKGLQVEKKNTSFNQKNIGKENLRHLLEHLEIIFINQKKSFRNLNLKYSIYLKNVLKRVSLQMDEYIMKNTFFESDLKKLK